MASLHVSLHLWIPACLHPCTLHACILHPFMPASSTPASMHSCIPASWTPESLNPWTPVYLHSWIPVLLHPWAPASLHCCTPATLHPCMPASCILEPLHPCILASLHPVPLHPYIPTSPLASHWLWLRAGIQVIGTPVKQEHAGLCDDSICRVLVKQTQRLKFDLLCSQNWCKGQAWWHVCDPKAGGVEKGGFWDPLDSSSS